MRRSTISGRNATNTLHPRQASCASMSKSRMSGSYRSSTVPFAILHLDDVGRQPKATHEGSDESKEKVGEEAAEQHTALGAAGVPGASAGLRGGSPRHSKPRPRASLRTARNYLGLRYGDCYDFVCTQWRSSSDGGPSCRRRPGHTQRPSRRRCARTSTSTGTAARKLGGHIPTRPEYKHPFRLLRGPPHRRILSTSPKRACWRTTSHACE